MKWEKKIPNKEGIWLRQCAAKGHETQHMVTKFVHEDGTERLIMDWGWAGETDSFDLLNLNAIMKNKIGHFYYYGPIPLPPESNKLSIVIEGSGFNKPPQH